MDVAPARLPSVGRSLAEAIGAGMQAGHPFGLEAGLLREDVASFQQRDLPAGGEQALNLRRIDAERRAGLLPLRVVEGDQQHAAGLGPRAEHVSNIALQHVRRSEEHTSELQSLMRLSYAVL